MRYSIRAAAVAAVLALLAGCGGGGGDGDPGTGDGSEPAPVPVQSGPPGPEAGASPATQVLSGKATFDYVPNVAGKLRYEATQIRPIEGATLEVIDASTREVLVTTQTAAQGAWSASVPAGRTLKVRVKAQLLSPGRWSVEVRDNTTADALYAIETPSLTAGQLRADLHAASGWTGGGYGEERSAGPFAILATIRASQEKVLSADPAAAFPPLAVYWSPRNVSMPFGGNRAIGEIGSTQFRRFAVPMAIDVLGLADADTDEYDESVVAHEWGHYYQAVFSRNDSLNGPHGDNTPLEMTVAFSEGWGDGWQAIALGRSDYADSLGKDQQEPGLVYALSEQSPRRGWFSERSVAAVVAGLAQRVGFAPVHRAMQSLRDTPAYTSIHSFSQAVRRGNPPAADVLDGLLQSQGIVPSLGSDDFGRGEANDGGLLALDVNQPEHYFQPLYLPLPDGLDRFTMVCSSALYGRTNKHGVYRALRFDVPAAGRYLLAVVTADASFPYVSWRAGDQRVLLSGRAGFGSQWLDLTPGPFVFSVADGRVRDSGSTQDYDCLYVTIGRSQPASSVEN